MEAAEPRPLAAGTMLDDKYRIERLLAVGGMGAVYVGTHIKLRKRVAIKILNPELSTPMMIERFHREAITASQIGHEGIAQVTDLGTSRDNEPFLVMEYLEGESLAARLRSTGKLPIEVACELGCAILSPLAAAHHAGIVHRDLKPDNVFLVRQSRGEMVKLLDFGISRTTTEQAGEFRLTTTGLVLGTPYYMSPEQARGETQVGPATDLYAFGVILYEMLVGAVPIQAENYNQLMYRVMAGEYQRPIQRRADIPPALDQLIMQTMALEAQHRPPSAQDLEQALLAFCRPTFREHTIERMSQPQMASRTTPPPIGSLTPGGSAAGVDPTLLATPGSAMSLASKHAKTIPSRPMAAQKAPKSKAGLVIAAVALLGIAGGTIAIVASQGGDDKQPAAKGSAEVVVAPTPPTPPTPPPVVDPPLPKPPPTPEQITLRFSVEPKSAAITVDDQPVKDGELVVPKDDKQHTVKITAANHQPHEEQIAFDETQRISVSLKRVTRTAPPRPPKAGKNQRIEDESPYK